MPPQREYAFVTFQCYVYFVAVILGIDAGTVLGATAQEAISIGDAALLRFDLDAAFNAYHEAARLGADNYEALWKLSRTLIDKSMLTTDRSEQKQLYIEAERLARTAVHANPRDAKGHVYVAIAVGKLALYERGRREVELSREVKAEAEEAIKLNPNEDLAYHVLGIWNREMVRLNWVLKKFTELLYGSFPPASLSSALDDFRHAVKLAPKAVAHHVEFGITLASAGEWTEAKTELETALTLPKGWIIDEYYWGLARKKLEEVNAHNHGRK